MCGNCCTGPEGYVLFTHDEGHKLAARLGISMEEFLRRYTKETSLGRSLAEKRSPHGLDCIFLDREKVPGKAVCGVYEDRPVQCRTWPFWKEIIQSKASWERTKRTCPGHRPRPLDPAREDPHPAGHGAVSRELAGEWLAAARDERVVLELEAIYTYIAAAIESRGPACWASGRCCNFKASGHLLYVTGLEAAYTVSHLDSPLSAASLEAAQASGGCPFQSANLCGVHGIKPAGCRVYFCDRSAQDWQRELSESMQTRLKVLHDRHAIPYRYGEWRAMLAHFVT
jgi:Fe-S-cluster containining protein